MAAWRKCDRFLITRWLRGVQQYWTGNRWTCDFQEGKPFNDLTSSELLAESLDGVILEIKAEVLK